MKRLYSEIRNVSLSVVSSIPNALVIAALAAGLMTASVARAQLDSQPTAKLTAPQLFPEKTLAYLRIDNVQELKTALDRSSIGKLAKDEQIRPILAEFYGSLISNSDAIREHIGLNLDELLSIPTGELAIALLPNDRAQGKSPRRRNADKNDSEEADEKPEVDQPSVAIMMDAGEEIAGVQIVLDRMRTSIGEENMVHTETKIGSLTLHQFANPERAKERFGYFIDQGVFIACSNPIGLERLATRWSGGPVDWPTLAENRRFTSIMSRCVGTQGERPHVSFFADPLAIVREVGPRSTSKSLVLATLPALGLDDIQAIGGSWIVAPPDFDSISHFHVLLGSPRRAILALLRPKSGSTVPEDWVPASVASYSTINWDAASTLQGVQQLFNQFRGENALQTEVFIPLSNRLQLDFKKDILENLEGRFTMIQGFVRPVRVNSGSNVYAIRLRNPEHFQRNVLPKLMELVGRRQELKVETFGRLQAQVFTPGRMPEGSALRDVEICVSMIDDYVIVADSRYMMNELATSMNSSEERLSQALDFQMIADRIKAQLQDKECSALTYARPEESLQLFYELARDPANRERLRQVSADNGFFKALLAALDNHKLPEFSVIAKYLAPAGGFLVEEETGLHYMSFGLRRE